MNNTLAVAQAVKAAAPKINNADTVLKNTALENIAKRLIERQDEILAANSEDIARAEKNGMPKQMIDRLLLNEKRVSGIADAVLELVDMSDPIGKVEDGSVRPNGLSITKVRVPLGTVGIIYESRPNVSVDAAVLCIKAGNAVLLRGGKEAISSNCALVDIMKGAIEEVGLPKDCIALIKDTSRESATEMMKLNGILDVLIPRGGAGLIRAVVENSTVPVIETGTGNCHIYVHKQANLQMALDIVFNAKVSRPSVCNAAESLLVDKDIADKFLPALWERFKEAGVSLYGCQQSCEILFGIEPATEEDYAIEYLDYKMSVKVVENVEEAVKTISKYSTGHSESIVTDSVEAAEYFLRRVDSTAVYLNASTRFTDGGMFGYGAEIGISTQKLHARGPMGLNELTTIKYLIRGNGQIRE